MSVTLHSPWGETLTSRYDARHDTIYLNQDSDGEAVGTLNCSSQLVWIDRASLSRRAVIEPLLRAAYQELLALRAAREMMAVTA